MIAANRRLAIPDFLLVVLAVAAIFLALSPIGSPRQSLSVRDPSGNIKTYSLALDDPRLVSLRRAIARAARVELPGSLAYAQWRAEVCEFYESQIAASTSAAGGQIVQASFSRSDAKGAATHAPSGEGDSIQSVSMQRGPSGAEYWDRAAALARESAASIESAWKEQIAQAGPPKFAIGDTTRGRLSPNAFLGAALCGLAAASLMAVWAWRFPTLSLEGRIAAGFAGDESPGGVTMAEDRVGRVNLELAIPAAWVRVRQSRAVRARQWTVTALSCSAAVLAVLRIF